MIPHKPRGHSIAWKFAKNTTHLDVQICHVHRSSILYAHPAGTTPSMSGRTCWAAPPGYGKPSRRHTSWQVRRLHLTEFLA